MSPRPYSFRGWSEVITASCPASVSCWRQARAVSRSSKSLTMSQSSKAASPTLSSARPSGCSESSPTPNSSRNLSPRPTLGGGLNARELGGELSQLTPRLGILGLRVRGGLARAVEVVAIDAGQLGGGDQPHRRLDPVLQWRHRLDTGLPHHVGRHVRARVQAVGGDAGALELLGQ